MKINTLSLVLSVICLGAGTGEVLAQTTFYVDATLGRDTYNGTTPDVDEQLQQGPWKSIERVQAQTLAPGDEILFKRGEIWRELLSFSSSGSAGQPITLGAYASGPPPIISGADAVSGWTKSDPARGIYRANVTAEPAVVFVGATRGRRRASIGQLARANDWCWAAGILSVRSPAAPGATVEAGARGTAVAILGQSYITVQDVMLERTNGSGLYVETSTRATSNIIVQRVTARASRSAGIAFKNGHPTFETTAVLLSENTVYENGASGIDISEGVSDITITRNVSHHNNWSGDIYEAGIRVWADRRRARNLVIEHNETHGMYFTYTEWETAYGGPTQSVRADARFAGTGDFRLATTSPCLRAGIELGLVMDILGAPVPAGSPPDQGAYQGAAGEVVRFGRARSAGQTVVDAQRIGGNSRPGVAPPHLLVAGLTHRDRRPRILQQP